jgi:hypothetical protein
LQSTATVADIAARAGVGTATVDRVLNKRPGVNADTVRRVLQAVAEVGGPAPRPAVPPPAISATSTSPRSRIASTATTRRDLPSNWRNWPTAPASR